MDYDDYEDDYEWDYIEDAYDEADNLAEHACPSPPYLDNITSNLSFEGEDPYDIWVDLEYLSDSYYDNPNGIETKKTGEAHKRKSKSQSQQARKRQRLSQSDVNDVPEPAIIFRKTDDRGIPLEDKSVKRSSHRPVALLKDWKERFRHSNGLAAGTASNSQSQSPEASPNPQAEISGEGFDLSSIESIAGVLPEEAINTLRDIIKAKGLDPEAVQVVLQDLLEGREPDFGEPGEEEEDMDEDGDEQMEEIPASTLNILSDTSTESALSIGGMNSLQQPIEDRFISSSTSESGRVSGKKRKLEPSSEELRPVDTSSPLQSHVDKKHKQNISNAAKSLDSVNLDGHGARLEDKNALSGSDDLAEPVDLDESINNENQEAEDQSRKVRGAKTGQKKAETSKSTKSGANSALTERPAISKSSRSEDRGKGKRKAETLDGDGDHQGSATNGAGLRRSVRAAKKPRSK